MKRYTVILSVLIGLMSFGMMSCSSPSGSSRPVPPGNVFQYTTTQGGASYKYYDADYDRFFYISLQVGDTEWRYDIENGGQIWTVVGSSVAFCDLSGENIETFLTTGATKKRTYLAGETRYPEILLQDYRFVDAVISTEDGKKYITIDGHKAKLVKVERRN